MSMRLEELKKGLWGYKKEGVFQYITDMEDTCARKLQEKDAQLRETEQRAQTRIQTLEGENRALRAELEKLREQQDQISRAILDARASAEAMQEETRLREETARAETRAREEKARETVRRTLDGELAELSRYQEKLDALRGEICRTLEGMERQAAELAQRAERLAEESPEGNLTLFQ